jgi:Flp pilus assembly protein TadD
MKKLLIASLLVVASIGTAVAAESPLANAGRKGLQAKTIDEMLALPEEEIDIGLGALLIGKEYDPDLDVSKYLAQLDQMAHELCARITEEKSPRKLTGLLNDYIFRERGYAAVGEGGGQATFLIHVLLQHGKGDCSGLSTLYLALAERLGIPLFGVLVPGHLFVRYESDGTTVNVEPTQAGARHWNVTYAIGYSVPRTDAAGSFYMRSLTKREFLGTLLSDLGYALGRQRKFEEAVQADRRALGINPNFGVAWYNLGLALWGQGKPHGAVEAYRKALAINPRDAMALTNLGVALHAQGRLDEAVAAHKKSLAIDPSVAEAWTNLGAALRLQGKLDEAVRACRKALAINSSLAEAWTNLGAALSGQGKSEEAARALRKAISINADLAQAWANLAVAHYRMGEYASAWECVRRCQQAGGKVHPDFLRDLGRKMEPPES